MKKLYFLLNLLLFVNVASATITIDSVRTVISTCPNNGSILIYARTDNPPLLYSLTGGPETRPYQSGSTFNGLHPGLYTFTVTNFGNETATQTATIKTNYTEPDFHPYIQNIFCGGTQIVGHADLRISKKPFIWVMTNDFNSTSITQTSDTFNVYRIGTYTLRLYDSCNNFVTRSIEVNYINPGINESFYGTVKKIGCDTIVLRIYASISASANISELTVKAYHGNDTISKVVDVTTRDPFPIYDTFPNLTYGSELHFSVETICGRKIINADDHVAPYKFAINFEPLSRHCNTTLYYGRIFPIEDYLHQYFSTEFKSPLRLTMKDIDSNKIVFDSLLPYSLTGVGGRKYEFTITDGCGQSYTFDTTWRKPQIDIASVTTALNKGCIDSTAYVTFYFSGWSAGTILEILSGPKYLHSTKPAYAYYDSIVYPQSYTFTRAPSLFSLKNLPKGIYSYKVTDTCGNIKFGSFEVKNSDLSNFGANDYQYWYKPGCLNGNTFFFQSTNTYKFLPDLYFVDLNTHRGFGSYSVYNAQPYIIYQMPAGRFQIQLSNRLGGQKINVNIDSCVVLYDTIEVKDYERPRTKSVTIFECNGNITAVLNPDSTKGVPPYRFEVISGPRLYPLQASNIFSFIPQGVYRSRIVDTCGNSNVLDFSVDTLLFPKLTKIGSSCINGNVVLFFESSPFFTYYWTRPDGTIYIGDSIRINGVQPEDTGMYYITRYVNINGCKDSSKIAYDLLSNAEYITTMTICEGESVTVGQHVYTQPGYYTDTIFSTACDTIKYLNLFVNPEARTTIDTTLCIGRIYHGYHQFYSQPGTYYDTISTRACDSIITINLSFVQAINLQIHASKTVVTPVDTVQLWYTSDQLLGQTRWSPFSILNNAYRPDPIATISKPTWIYLDVISYTGCVDLDSIFIDIYRAPSLDTCNKEGIFIPNAFSPNGDGINDIFLVRSESLKSGKLILFDRFGNKVFESSDLKMGWNGIYKGEKAAQDVYGYYFEGICTGEENITLKGNFTLLR